MPLQGWGSSGLRLLCLCGGMNSCGASVLSTYLLHEAPSSLPRGFSRRSWASSRLVPSDLRVRVPHRVHSAYASPLANTTVFTHPLGVLGSTDLGAQR